MAEKGLAFLVFLAHYVKSYLTNVSYTPFLKMNEYVTAYTVVNISGVLLWFVAWL